MARIAKRKEDAVWYIPDIDENRDDVDPFMVLLSPLSAADMRKLEQFGLGKVTKKGTAEINFMERAQQLQERIIKERVLDVKNYSVMLQSAEGKEEVFTPTNGKELLKAIMQAGASEAIILDDIVEALKDTSMLDEGTLGN
tara:strand:+ start:375 stop:797 length:423 start_codon:yes stop_codon:yes gene_type:complete